MSVTPANIIAQLLENQDLGHNPDESTVGLTGNSLDWPIYINHSPSETEQFLVVYDTTGTVMSESMRSGLPFTREGIQVKAQAESHDLCDKILRLIKSTLSGLTREVVTVSSASYQVESISATSTVMRNGKVSPEYTQHFATLNLLFNYTTL